MWENHTGNWYNLTDEGNIVASIQHHDKNDGCNPETHGIQITPANGGIVVIGYISESSFVAVEAQRIADKARAMRETYEWWMKNAHAWFTSVSA